MRTKATNGNAPLSWRARIKALGNLPRFFRLVWETSPGIMLGNVVLRVGRSAIPVSILYVGKLIIDQVVALAAGARGVGGHAVGLPAGPDHRVGLTGVAGFHHLW